MEILLCRCSAQKIGTDSGKKLQKKILNLKKYTAQPARNTPLKKPQQYLNKKNKITTSHTTKNSTSTTVVPKTRSKTQKPQPKTPSPYDPQNPYKEPQSGPKDITCKDIEKHLIENDPSKGSQTDMDTQRGDEAENDSFETIEPDQDNPVKREFEIGELGNQELKEDELTRDETGNGSLGNTKASQRKF